MKKLLIKLIKKYQSIPFKSHDSCKFIPTCSNYMIEALETHGLIKGLYLGTKRLLKCNTFTKKKYTYDPVYYPNDYWDYMNVPFMEVNFTELLKKNPDPVPKK
jgi:uncharacterized protein